ncbi:MAG TPA: RHS repeat-associated core domain-containing protein, partial [Fibrobacteria bacterium]|nr:RHS repeat-associated core domain-containing protein [Fibrobacteria bacterium]
MGRSYHTTISRYDAAGRKVEVVDALGRSTRTHYDPYDRVTLVGYPDGGFDSTEYDADGRKAATVDAMGRRTEFAYDDAGQLTGVKEPSGDITTYAYDGSGNRISQTDAKHRTTTFHFDALNRQTAKVYVDGAVDSTEFDIAGNVSRHIAPNGDITVYRYDLLNREVLRTLPSGKTVATTWNVDGSRATILDEQGLTQYGYDVRGRLASQTNPDGTVLGYSYDASGNIAKRTTPWGTTRYAYDAVGRVDSVLDTRAGTVTQSWDALGRLASVQRPNGVFSQYGYSARGLLDTVTHTKGGQSLASFTYAHDLSGLRTGANEAWGSSVTPVGWTHDANQRLTQETKASTANGWGYDEVSNRTSQTSGGSTIQAFFDNRDRLTTLGTSSFTWDVAGRLTSRTEGGQTTHLGWQDDDRLTQVDLSGGTSVGYTYDPQGLMVSRADGNGTENYTWDATLPYGQIVGITDGAGTLKSRQVWGMERLAEIRNDTVRWLLTDGLGNVRAITDSTGKIIGREDFDAWGNPTLDSGATSRFGYRGEWSDPATGLVYLRARWMDPTTGRFVSEDPFEGRIRNPVTLHRYLYANSGPVNIVDHSGYDGELGEEMAGMAGDDILSTMATVSFRRLAFTGVVGGGAGGAGYVASVIAQKYNAPERSWSSIWDTRLFAIGVGSGAATGIALEFDAVADAGVVLVNVSSSLFTGLIKRGVTGEDPLDPKSILFDAISSYVGVTIGGQLATNWI